MASTPTGTEAPQAEVDKPKNQITIKRILLAWAILVVILFFWQSSFYLGLIERAAEWQFYRVGSYYPALTLAVFVFLFGAPLAYIFSRRANRALEIPTENGLAEAKRFYSVLIGVATVFTLAAIIAGCIALSVRESKVAPRLVDAGSTPAPLLQSTTLTGRLLYDRRVTAGTSVLMISRSATFAPIVAQNGQSGSIRYFAQVDGADGVPGTRSVTGSVTGLLRKNALRGDALELFQDAGYKIADPYYVLFTSERAAREPYYVAAAQFAMVALVLALAALYQRRRIRRFYPGLRKGTPHAVG